MSFLLGAGRWFLSVIIFLLISIWMSIIILQNTLLNRSTVLGWLEDSGVYDKAFSSLVQINMPEGGEHALPNATDVTKALQATFPPATLQKHTETVINATYDWAEGKTKTITFTIELDESAALFRTNLATQIEPAIAALPECASRFGATSDQPKCRPKGVSPADFATQLTQKGEGDEFLSKPLDSQSLGMPPVPADSWIPGVIANMRWTAVALPFGIIALAVAYIWMNENKLRGLANLGRHEFFGGLTVAIVGMVAVLFGGQMGLASASQSLDDQQKTIVTNLIDPLLHLAIPDIGRVVLTVGGIVTVIGGGAWLTAHLLRKRQNEQEPELHTAHTAAKEKPSVSEPETPKPKFQPKK